MPNPLNMPVILTGTPFVEGIQQQIVQQGETGIREGIIRVDQLIDQERNEVQQLLPADNPEIREKGGGNPRQRRRRREDSGDEIDEPSEVETADRKPEEEGKGSLVDIEA